MHGVWRERRKRKRMNISKNKNLEKKIGSGSYESRLRDRFKWFCTLYSRSDNFHNLNQLDIFHESSYPLPSHYSESEQTI